MATEAEHLEELYQEERGRLARSVRGLVGEDRAQDLVQDTFVTFLTRGGDVEHPRAWLGRVARNRALNDLRRAREVALDDHDLPTDERVSGLEREALRETVRAALCDLDERSRHALQLRFFDELDYPEIAEELGVRLPQAHVIVHRAVRRLGRRIVRALAEAHDAASCADALEEMVGMGARANGHGAAPCDRCRPVADELSALRGLGAMLPMPVLPMLWRRIAHAVSVRAPAVTDVADRAAAAVVAFGVSFASLASPPGAPVTPAVDRPHPQRQVQPAAAADDQGARAGREPERSGSGPTRDRNELEPKRVDEVGPVTVREEEEATQVEAGGDEPVGGVVVCRPLEPCPPNGDE